MIILIAAAFSVVIDMLFDSIIEEIRIRKQYR